MVQKCGFCSRTSIPELIDHDENSHDTTKDNSNNNILIRRIGNRFITFSIDYDPFKNVSDFFDPDKIIGSFIETVARKIPDEEGEFGTMFSIMNQSAAEIEVKRIYSKTFWSNELVLGRMKDQRVREFLYLNTKKGS